MAHKFVILLLKATCTAYIDPSWLPNPIGFQSVLRPTKSIELKLKLVSLVHNYLALSRQSAWKINVLCTCLSHLRSVYETPESFERVILPKFLSIELKLKLVSLVHNFLALCRQSAWKINVLCSCLSHVRSVYETPGSFERVILPKFLRQISFSRIKVMVY